jgi:hypothetical protein
MFSVVVSQACDIVAKAEPYVEVAPAHSAVNKDLFNQAKKGNSSRIFLVKENPSNIMESVIADATRRGFIKKDSLLGRTWTDPFESNEARRMKFGLWFGDRYKRPGLPSDQIAVIQKPLADTLQELLKKGNSEIVALFGRIDELRFDLTVPKPWIVSILAISADGQSPLTIEEVATVNDWISKTITGADKEKQVASIKIIHRVSSQVSIRDYRKSSHLALDHYSD